MKNERENIVNSNNSSIQSPQYTCPICKLEGIATVLKSSTYTGLTTSKTAHFKNKHGIKLSEIPPDKRYNDSHLVLLYKALKRMKKK